MSGIIRTDVLSVLINVGAKKKKNCESELHTAVNMTHNEQVFLPALCLKFTQTFAFIIIIYSN